MSSLKEKTTDADDISQNNQNFIFIALAIFPCLIHFQLIMASLCHLPGKFKCRCNLFKNENSIEKVFNMHTIFVQWWFFHWTLKHCFICGIFISLEVFIQFLLVNCQFSHDDQLIVEKWGHWCWNKDEYCIEYGENTIPFNEIIHSTIHQPTQVITQGRSISPWQRWLFVHLEYFFYTSQWGRRKPWQ